MLATAGARHYNLLLTAAAAAAPPRRKLSSTYICARSQLMLSSRVLLTAGCLLEIAGPGDSYCEDHHRLVPAASAASSPSMPTPTS